MEAKAIGKFIRISPRKMRLVVDLIRGKNANNSVNILEAMTKKAAKVTNKVLVSAIANAKQKELDVDKLFIKKITVDGGPAYKRYMPRAMGRATIIKRPTSHITVILSDETKSNLIQETVEKKDSKDKSKKVSKLARIRRKKTETKKIESKTKTKKTKTGKKKS